MGIYTSNRYFGEAYDYASEIPANEAYGAALGCAQILADCQVNDMALFENTIYNDFAEVRAVQEGVGYVNENAFTDVIKKIVEMFKKLLAKIKGIFSAFLAKLTGAFKNGKDLVKKYEKQIIKYSNWKDFKCKGIRVPKSSGLQGSIDKLFQANKVSAVGYSIETAADNMLVDTHLPEYKTVEKIKDADSEDIKNAIIKLYVPDAKVTDIADLHEDVMNYLFEDKETLDGDDQVKSASYFSADWIKTILSEGDKWEKDVKKFNDKLEKNINTIIDNLNKDDDKLAKFMTDKDNSGKKIGGSDYNRGATKGVHYAHNYGESNGEDKVQKQSGSDFSSVSVAGTNKNGKSTEDVQKAIHALQKLASNEQEVITKITSEYMTVVKFSLAQARKVWTAAAAWSSGVHKESVDYCQAVGDTSAEQFYSVMEAIH